MASIHYYPFCLDSWRTCQYVPLEHTASEHTANPHCAFHTVIQRSGKEDIPWGEVSGVVKTTREIKVFKATFFQVLALISLELPQIK